MTIFIMLIPLCWAPGRADRVTPLFRFVCADARFYHPTFRLNRRGNGSRLFEPTAALQNRCKASSRFMSALIRRSNMNDFSDARLAATIPSGVSENF